MASYRFHYTSGIIPPSPAFPSGFPVKRPYLKLALRNGTAETGEILGSADTGADFCTFSAGLLPSLGLDKSNLPIAGAYGLSAEGHVFCARVTLIVPPIGEWEIYAGFSETMDPDTAMLGHLDFLERFTAVFDHKRALFTLEEKLSE